MNWQTAFEILKPIPTPDYVSGAWNEIRYHKCKAVFDLAGQVPPNSCIVELGTWRGLTAAALALGSDPSVTVYTLDDYNSRRVELVSQKGITYEPEDFEILVENMRKLPPDVADRIVQIRKEVRQTADTWDKPIGLLFWDMWGERLHDDIAAWTKHVVPGGIVAVKVFEDGRLHEESLEKIDGLTKESFDPQGLILTLRKSAKAEHAIWIVDGERYLTEAKLSAASVLKHMPKIEADIIMPRERKHEEWFIETTRLLCDVLEDIPDGDKVLWLDSDTYMCEPVPELFQMLSAFHICMAHAPGHKTAPTVRPLPDCFPEFNIGVVAMVNSWSVRELWKAVYEEQVKNIATYGNNDQAALRERVYEGIMGLRFTVLPAEYNCRFQFGCQVRDRVKILHGRAESVAHYETLAKSINAGWREGYQVPPRMWSPHVPR